MQFETKIAVVLRDALAGWEKVNVTAFLVSGMAGTVPGVVGEPYRDASGERVPAHVRPARARLRGGRVRRAAVAVVPAEDLDLVEIAFRAERKTVDKIVDRLRFHP